MHQRSHLMGQRLLLLRMVISTLSDLATRATDYSIIPAVRYKRH